MRFIVMIDLVSMLTQPVTVAYVSSTLSCRSGIWLPLKIVYLSYLKVSPIMIAAIMQRKWDMILFYILAIRASCLYTRSGGWSISLELNRVLSLVNPASFWEYTMLTLLYTRMIQRRNLLRASGTQLLTSPISARRVPTSRTPIRLQYPKVPLAVPTNERHRAPPPACPVTPRRQLPGYANTHDAQSRYPSLAAPLLSPSRTLWISMLSIPKFGTTSSRSSPSCHRGWPRSPTSQAWFMTFIDYCPTLASFLNLTCTLPSDHHPPCPGRGSLMLPLFLTIKWVQRFSSIQSWDSATHSLRTSLLPKRSSKSSRFSSFAPVLHFIYMSRLEPFVVREPRQPNIIVWLRPCSRLYSIISLTANHRVVACSMHSFAI